MASPPSISLTLTPAPAGAGTVLRLSAPLPISPGRLLALEIDTLGLPEGAGQALKQRQRGRVRHAELVLEQEALSAWLSGPLSQDLRAHGIERLQVRLAPSFVLCSGLLSLGGRKAWLTARARLLPALAGRLAESVILSLGHIRVHGFLPVAQPLGLTQLCTALLAGNAQALTLGESQLTSPTELGMTPLALVLGRALPLHGYRVPDMASLILREARMVEGRIILSYADKGLAPAQTGAQREPASIGDAFLLSGDTDAALAAYRAQAKESPLARGRLLSILCSMPAHFDEARTLAAAELQKDPRSGPALLTLALIEAERGQAEQAAAHYKALSELPGNAPEEVATAALVAAECLSRVAPREAARLLERAAAIAGGPPSARATAQLTEAYTREERWKDLIQLEERQLSMVPANAPAERQRRHIRLAGLHLDRLHQPARAQAEIEHAIRLDEKNPTPWELKARILLSQGDASLPDALAALEQAAALSPPDVAAELLHRAGTLAERAGDRDAAIRCYRQALDHSPSLLASAERLADLLSAAGRHAEARAAHEAILEHSPGGEEGDARRRQALVALSRNALDHQHDPPSARGYLGRALALGGDADPAVLRAWATLEEAEGNLDEVDKALSRLQDLGERDGMLRRAEILVALERPAEAAHLLESIVAREEDQDQAAPALRLLIKTQQVMGDIRGVRDALERLLEITPEDRGARLELGRVLLAIGDLPAARWHLRHAGDDPTALSALAEVLSRLGDETALEEALQRLVASLDDRPSPSGERAAARGRLTMLLCRQDRRGDALVHLRRALLDLPAAQDVGDRRPAASSESNVRFIVGEAALALGRYEDAREAWDPLLSEPEGPAGPPASLALRLAELGERTHPAEALHFYQLALSRGASGQEAGRAWTGVIRLSETSSTDPRAAQESLALALVQAAQDPRTEEPPAGRAARLHLAGDIRQKLGQTEEARALYEQALALDPVHLPALDALISLAEQAGEDTRLAEVLSRKARALSDHPLERKLLLGRLGTLYADRVGRRDLARESFRQALALDPAFRPGLLFLAEDAHDRGDHGAELAHLKRLVSLGEAAGGTAGERAEIHARLAQVHRRAGRHEEVERQALAALRLCPDHLQALLLLDERYTSTERFAELADVLLRRAEVETDAIERRDALARRARILDQELGQPHRALLAYRDLVRIAPDPSSCVRLAALTLLQEAFDEIHDVAPVVGRALLDAGRGAEAIPILEHATKRGAGEPLFALLAEAYETVGDDDRAADAWSSAGTTADPERHARALERADRLEEALAVWVGNQAHHAAAALARRAMTKDPAEAVSWARRLLEVDPADTGALVLVIGARPVLTLPPLLDALGRRLTREEAAAAWLAAARALPEERVEARLELIRRSLELAPAPDLYLLLSTLVPEQERLEVLHRGHGAYPEDPALVLAAAHLYIAHGDREAGRTWLQKAGDDETALHARVQLDLHTLTEAAPGSNADLHPVLLALHERHLCTPEEQLALARLQSARGQQAEAALLQLEAGGDPDDLLAALEAQGHYPELLDALAAHASVRPADARKLHEHAAHIAENQLGDPRKAALLLEQAAFCQGPESDAAVLWSRAGNLWNLLGERERGASALGRALSAGGEKTPLVLLALGDYAFDQGDWDTSARHYRRALAVGQVPPGDRGRIRLRLASVERRRGNAAAEEQELAAAVEAGAGATAWPALAALFRAQGESARLGAALLAWADHESGPPRLALLKQAATLVSPSLLPRVDDELTKLDADDEEVRDRVQARLRQAGDLHQLAEALVRDIDKSDHERRASAARELAALCEQLGDPVATASAWRVVLESSQGEDCQRDSQAALHWLSRAREAGVELPADLATSLRTLLISQGKLGEAISQIDQQVQALPDDGAHAVERLDLMREAARLADSLEDAEGAFARWIRISALHPEDPVAPQRSRHLLRTLIDTGRASLALTLIEGEVRGLGPTGTFAPALRVHYAELLAQVGRSDEAIGQLDLVLMRHPGFGPAHSLLGLLLVHAQQPPDLERGLSHLYSAAHAPDVDRLEAGECALLAADLLMNGVALSAEEGDPPASSDPRALLSHAADLLPKDPRPLDALYRLALLRGHHDDALLYLERQLDLIQHRHDPHDQAERAQLLTEKARVLRQQAHLVLAEAALREALQEQPQLLTAVHALRVLQAERGELEEADLLCQKEIAATLDPSARQTLFLELGQVRDQRHDVDGAIEAYRDAGQLGSEKGWQQVARLLSTKEEWLAAADAAGRAASLTPAQDRGAALLLAAELSLRAEDEPRARDHLTQAVNLEGQNGREAQQRLIAMDGGADPGMRKQILEERLQQTDGLLRIDLLRRLLLLAVEVGDDEAASLRAREVLALEPGDDLAFAEQCRLLRARADMDGLCALWQGRAAALIEPGARADALCTAAEISDVSLNDHALAEHLLLEAVALHPDHPSALLALADLAYRKGEYQRARSLYETPGLLLDLPASQPGAPELLERRAELAEAAGEPEAAERAYTQMLSWASAALVSAEADEVLAAAGTALVRAAESLTRLYQQRGDYAAAQRALGHLLPHLPEEASAEAIERRVQVRLHLAWLAAQTGDMIEARRHLQHLLLDRPAHREGLLMLLTVYRQIDEPAQAAEVLDRLVRVAPNPAERADLLYERAAIYEAQLDDPQRALELYQQATDVQPRHAPALRRLVVCYLREANGVGVAEAVREMEESGQTLDEVRYFAGIGLALASNDEHADRLLFGATAEDLALALSAIGLPRPGDLSILDEPIAAAIRALSGTAGLPLLEAALYARLHDAPYGIDVGVRQILARLAELRAEPSARVHLAVLAFLFPQGYASQRLEVLGQAPQRVLVEDPMPTSGRGPLRDALAILGRHVLGLPAPPLPLSPEWALRLRPLGHATGFPRLDVAILDDLGAGQSEPARCDPTRPPRLRLLRRLTADSAQARFAALRALRLLLQGVPLVQWRSPEDVVALIRAAAHLFLEDVPLTTPLSHSWLAELRSLGLRPDTLPREQREQAQAALRACMTLMDQSPGRLEATLPIFLEAAQRAAERQALAETGDLLAALLALAPDPAQDLSARLQALRQPALAELIAFADRQYR